MKTFSKAIGIVITIAILGRLAIQVVQVFAERALCENDLKHSDSARFLDDALIEEECRRDIRFFTFSI